MLKGIEMTLIHLNLFAFVFIVIGKREQLLRIKNGIEALTTENSETNEKSLKKFAVYEKRVIGGCLIGVTVVFATYLVPIANFCIAAAFDHELNFELPPQLATPYEITSLPVYLVSYAAICIGTYFWIFLSNLLMAISRNLCSDTKAFLTWRMT